MENNESRNNINDETISVEERNIFQDEFYPINYEIKNDSMQKEDYTKKVDINNNANIDVDENINNDIEVDIKNEDIKEQISPISSFFEPEETTKEILYSSANSGGKYNKKVLILYFIIGIILGTIFLVVITHIINNKEKTANCSYSIKDDVYTESEEYTITYLADEISYIEGVYSYITIPENNKEVEKRREEKIPVIANSNGMDGFTHVSEVGETSYKVNSYYDYELINFEAVEKNDQNKSPISYINIDSSKSYKKMKKDLENRGFKCINSK